ncbi:MAG: putative Dual specificity protein phosphatase CDC14A [Streblomastix strix]|uniref:protein-tyrosine-phosphatase n=1 Tax=Streblomastix strix TaxID=222440 RepID=A0A5J4X5L9_9EUKA|nr:MAG: putative Dual specificity protein phosphatase CDC14A [Streblomastix strix]
MTQAELNTAVEIIKDRFYFVVLRSVPRNTSSAFYFSTDNSLIYQPFSNDFGPLNMACLYRFCCAVEDYLKQTAQTTKKIYYYCANDQFRKANSVTLVCCYEVLYHNQTPDEAYRPFLNMYPPLPPFRDASYGPSTFNLSVLDVVRGIAKAKKVGFIDFQGGKFDLNEYEFYEKVENGDLNWILPGKYLAFSGPSNTEINQPNGICTHTPEFYVPYFKKTGITAVVRLNKRMYDRRRFIDHGIQHYDLYFVDGGIPTEAIVKQFLDLSEREGALAVHCKAGLGRTGTLIGCYMMKHYGFTATEVMGYVRICRPGSIIGPQQHFLIDIQNRMHKQGEQFRRDGLILRDANIGASGVISGSSSATSLGGSRGSQVGTPDRSEEGVQSPNKAYRPIVGSQTSASQPSRSIPSTVAPSLGSSSLNSPTISSTLQKGLEGDSSAIIDNSPSPLRGPMKHQGSKGVGIRGQYEGREFVAKERDKEIERTNSSDFSSGQGSAKGSARSNTPPIGTGSSSGIGSANKAQHAHHHHHHSDNPVSAQSQPKQPSSTNQNISQYGRSGTSGGVESSSPFRQFSSQMNAALPQNSSQVQTRASNGSAGGHFPYQPAHNAARGQAPGSSSGNYGWK